MVNAFSAVGLTLHSPFAVEVEVEMGQWERLIVRAFLWRMTRFSLGFRAPQAPLRVRHVRHCGWNRFTGTGTRQVVSHVHAGRRPARSERRPLQ